MMKKHQNVLSLSCVSICTCIIHTQAGELHMQSLGRMAEAADDELALEEEQLRRQPELLASISGVGQVRVCVMFLCVLCVSFEEDQLRRQPELLASITGVRMQCICTLTHCVL